MITNYKQTEINCLTWKCKWRLYSILNPEINLSQSVNSKVSQTIKSRRRHLIKKLIKQKTLHASFFQPVFKLVPLMYYDNSNNTIPDVKIPFSVIGKYRSKLIVQSMKMSLKYMFLIAQSTFRQTLLWGIILSRIIFQLAKQEYQRKRNPW